MVWPIQTLSLLKAPEYVEYYTFLVAYWADDAFPQDQDRPKFFAVWRRLESSVALSSLINDEYLCNLFVDIRALQPFNVMLASEIMHYLLHTGAFTFRMVLITRIF